MSNVRQDAWTEEEDLILSETVLRHIREGSTQLAAFEEVGKKLSRTAAACGFRWNSLVRKKYEAAIALAKKQRKEVLARKKSGRKKKREEAKSGQIAAANDANAAQAEWRIDIKAVIRYLEKLKSEEAELLRLREENERLSQEVKLEKEKRWAAEKAFEKVQSDYETIKREYQALLSIMERARKWAAAPGEEPADENEELPVAVMAHEADES